MGRWGDGYWGYKKTRRGAGFLVLLSAVLQNYLSKASTDCACWLACANMAVPAC